MQPLARRLSAGIIILLTTAVLAQAQVQVVDATPCDKVVPERVTSCWFLEAVSRHLNRHQARGLGAGEH